MEHANNSIGLYSVEHVIRWQNIIWLRHTGTHANNYSIASQLLSTISSDKKAKLIYHLQIDISTIRLVWEWIWRINLTDVISALRSDQFLMTILIDSHFHESHIVFHKFPRSRLHWTNRGTLQYKKPPSPSNHITTEPCIVNNLKINPKYLIYCRW